MANRILLLVAFIMCVGREGGHNLDVVGKGGLEFYDYFRQGGKGGHKLRIFSRRHKRMTPKVKIFSLWQCHTSKLPL